MKNIFLQLRAASKRLAHLHAEEKNKALLAVRDSLENNKEAIFAANERDIERAKADGLSAPLIERLSLNAKNFAEILLSLEILAKQTDPIGELISGKKLPNGLELKQIRVPIGVVAIIYESRPNVTVDAFALAYKSGNAVLLRGSSSAKESNKMIIAAIKEGLQKAGGITDAIAFSESEKNSYTDIDTILSARGYIDVVLPRGGQKLIRNVVTNAKIPVIETGAGLCHIFIDESADLKMAIRIIENAKLQKPAACNSIETLLVHRTVAEKLLCDLYEAFSDAESLTGKKGGVELFCDSESYAILKKYPDSSNVFAANETSWETEYLDYQLSVKVVENIDQALDHISVYSTKHSETIITENRNNARRFQEEIDAACVYVNASSRFTDGGQFGFGAEIGISTQKLHARGPMGLTALTTSKYIIDGDGQVRK
ncbi:glutamate-5-semialdehyde dehydrogenase [Treponema phagedenis]|uniref:Gamma-glutamyl phosphate reductase n=1 Tax=Treponema phagedenis TaxID=162 RepID=A0A0B7GY54_TREPH|nr:glutamate-5-semialdehyde dehydrogenase [Treponema phagedenis]EFW37970.1 glutamate-5-semialdehyde dehydrogenase [Treponema phagedenis F0421]QEJ95266.1 glutamate-5-semialdehyde dehydrogenase [Treponema phagedenis]QEJ98369.1 glutamate-5-semialdehyde dehydrogenase [Treponema phagedenis]QEK01119.1 glutamate-5-semialdehyde dehydrogenase [Treponema phagedenis]QEK03879.1 glutamate-5-semialdehyde dehydrogenase [Treponema phagedenis]